MLTVKIYKDKSGNFKGSNIEFTNEKAFNLIWSALVSELNIVENNIGNVENDNVKKMLQNRFGQIAEMLDQLNNPTIIKNERSELIQQMKQVYKTLDDYSQMNL